MAPRFEGAEDWRLGIRPLISIGRRGAITRFASRNDNAAIAIVDTPGFRAGVVGQLLLERRDTNELRGLGVVPFGAEVGGFLDFFPADWLRLRAEVRQGFRAHEGVVADVAADGFADITPTLRLSGGPRLSLATSRYFQAYYGVDLSQAAASGLSEYSPGGGVRSVGFGGALTWRTTETLTTSLFAEYSRLLGPAAESSLVRERGSVHQLTIGVSASYRFDFSM